MNIQGIQNNMVYPSTQESREVEEQKPVVDTVDNTSKKPIAPAHDEYIHEDKETKQPTGLYKLVQDSYPNDDNKYLTWISDANSYPMVAISQMQLQWADGCLDDVTYNSSETKSITYKVTNTGNTMLSNLTVNLSGDSTDNFEVNGFNSTKLEPNETAEFTVSLITGTVVGNYTASIDVSGNVDASGESIDGEPLQTTELSFSQKVNKAVSKLSEIEATDETIDGFNDGSLKNVTKEMEYV